MHDNTLTDDNRDKFNYIAGKYNQTIKFYNVEILCRERIEEFRKMFAVIVKGAWTVASYYPFLIPEVIPKDVDKVIYLDSDTVVNLNVAILWNVELENKILAVVPNTWRNNIKNYTAWFPIVRNKLVKLENAFNSGVYVMNIKKFSTSMSKLNNDIKYIVENFKGQMLDDEALLNYSFSENTVKLPLKFNNLVRFAREDGDYDVRNVIAHYYQRVIGIDFNDSWTTLYYKYFVRTPWFNEKAVSNICVEILKIYNDQINRAVWLTNLFSTRQRLFCVSAKYAEMVKKKFEIKDDEDLIHFEANEPEDKLIESVNQSQSTPYTLVENKSGGTGFSFAQKNRKVFIIFNENFGKCKAALMSIGLKEWQDFFNGTILLDEKSGVPFDSWRIVRNM